MRKLFLKKLVVFISIISVLAQSLSPFASLVPQNAYAQEVTSAVDQSTQNPTPTIDQAQPTEITTPTNVPTDTLTPTPTEALSPTDTPTVDNLSPPASSENNSVSSASTPTLTPTPAPEPATGNEELSMTILKNVSAPSIDLGAVQTESATLITDKADYAPTDTALITGSNLLPNTTYTLTVSSENNPPTSKDVSVTSDDKGVFVYAYQLDGHYRPNYKAELKDETGTVVATTTFTDTPVSTILVSNLQPNYTSAGGGGVYSAYYGPTAYGAVSPGSTAVYLSREAAPISAGLTIDPVDNIYEDQGLFGFKPGDTPISTFAAQPLTYDFANQYGTAPVWVYIELNKGVAGDIMYQYVPTSNPSWHTEDAGTGTHWQAWTNTTDGVTTGPMLSLADIAALDSSKTVSRVFLTEGMGNSYHSNPNGTVAWVDKVTIGSTLYDFVLAPASNPTTNPATGISLTDATLNGTNGGNAATGHSFWVSTSTFSTASPSIPSGVYSTPDLGAVAANAPFSASLSSITTTGVPSNLPAVTPGTLYHFVAWSLVGGTWYPGEVLSFTTDPGPVFIDTNTNGVWNSGEASFNTIQEAVDAAVSGNTIHVTAGTYTEVGQIVIDKNLSIVGDDKATTIIKPAQDTASSGDGRGWFLTVPGTTFNMSGVTLDGVGKNIFVGIYDYSLGTIQNINIKNIGFTLYEGRAIYLKNNATVSNVRFENIGRIGVYLFQGATAAVIDHITYVGKGLGDHLDYGVELENGAVATITNSTISDAVGVATSDGSTSAGILVTTFFGLGTTATITGNTISNSTDGIAVGYDASDTSTVVAHNNNLSGNIEYGVNSTAPTVDATNNWWGNASGPKDTKSLPGSPNYNNPSGTGSPVTSYVKYEPWFTNSSMGTLSSANPTTVDATGVTTTDATLNGTNGNYDASNTSFWWGTSSAGSLIACTDCSSQFPSGWNHDSGIGDKSAGASFSEALTGLTPGTLYHFVAWSEVGGTWYPGAVLNFTTVSPDTTAPATPSLVSPVDGVYRHTSNSNKSDWTDESDPSAPVVYYYESSLSTTTNPGDGSFASTAYTSGALTDSEIMNPGEPEVTYYWHVKACDSLNNCSSWSPAWQINIDNTAPTTPGQIGWTTENPPVGSDYASGTDFDNYRTCGESLNYSPMTNLWGSSTDANGVVGYDREVYSPDAASLIYSSSLSTNYVNGGGAVNGTTYWARVRAYDAAGNKSAWTNKCAITYDTSAPTITVDSLSTTDHTPQLTGSVNDHSAALDITVDGTTYTGTNNGDGTWTLADDTVTPALSDGIYDVSTSATDTAGNIGSDLTTNELTVATAAVLSAATTSTGGGGGGTVSAPACTDTKPGSAPTLISATGGLNSVTITWSEASDPVSYYLVAYGTSSGAQTYGNPNVGGKGTTSYAINNLSGGVTYYFKVRAGNGCAPGDYSNELSAAVSGGIVTGPAAGFAPGVLGASTAKVSPTPTESKEVLGAETAGTTPTPTPKNLVRALFTNRIDLLLIFLLVAAFMYYFYRRLRKKV